MAELAGPMLVQLATRSPEQGAEQVATLPPTPPVTTAPPFTLVPLVTYTAGAGTGAVRVTPVAAFTGSGFTNVTWTA